jgi:hypothetical protein
MEEEIKKQIRRLGPSDWPYIDVPYLSKYLTDAQIVRLRDHYYGGRVMVLSWKVIKRGPDAGKIKGRVHLRNKKDRSPVYLTIDPVHLVLM